MKSATESVEDGENILGEFLFGAVIRVVENQDPAAVLFGKPLDELESEPGKPVSMGNHNSELIAAVKSLQYGDKSFSPEVESSADVGHDFGVGVSFSHEADLPDQVFPLLGAADPAATDDDSVGGFPHEGVNVVPALSRCCSDCLYPAFIRVPPQSVLVDPKLYRGLAAWYVWHSRYCNICWRLLTNKPLVVSLSAAPKRERHLLLSWVLSRWRAILRNAP